MTEELRAALTSGADPDEKDEFGTTSLQYAVAERKDEAITVLLDHGADVTAQDRDGRTALHYAIEYGLPNVAALLLERNPRVVTIGDNHGNEPLWVATLNAQENYELVSLLMQYGANSAHRNRANRSALDFANQIDDHVLRKMLKSAGLPAKD